MVEVTKDVEEAPGEVVEEGAEEVVEEGAAEVAGEAQEELLEEEEEELAEVVEELSEEMKQADEVPEMVSDVGLSQGNFGGNPHLVLVNAPCMRVLD